MQHGSIARLNLSDGFGYVRDDAGEHSYIFLVGKAMTHAHACALRVGQSVRFRVSGQGQVEELKAKGPWEG